MLESLYIKAIQTMMGGMGGIINMFRPPLPSIRRPLCLFYCLAPFCCLRFLPSRAATRLSKDSRWNQNWLGRMAKRVIVKYTTF